MKKQPPKTSLTPIQKGWEDSVNAIKKENPGEKLRFTDYWKWGAPIGLDDTGKPFSNKDPKKK